MNMRTNNCTRTLIASLFSDNVVTQEANPILVRDSIYPEEQAFIQRAEPKRRREFIAGRLCARQALSAFGITGVPLLIGENGEPLWPDGFVGSISHTNGYCGVAVSRKQDFLSIGLDVESWGDIDDEIKALVCTEQEFSWLKMFSISEQSKYLALIFSAKECFYKCQFPVTKKWLEFKDIWIFVDISAEEFIVRPIAKNLLGENACLRGRYFFTDRYVFTGITIANSYYS